jgi:hypothetical protein
MVLGLIVFGYLAVSSMGMGVVSLKQAEVTTQPPNRGPLGVPDAFAIQVRNEVLGGPYAVAEKPSDG